MLIPFVACQGGNVNPKQNNEVNEFTLQEEESCFKFFWETQTSEEYPGAGLIPDRYPSNGLASIASVGFGLAAFPIGVENEWITYQEGKERAIMTLTNMKKLKTIEGFYYHFYYEKSGKPADCEVSVIDTAIFIIGALAAGEYFGDEVKTLANEIYAQVNWKWYVKPSTNQFYMGYDPKTQKHEGKWDTYGEQLMMYFLGAGAPNEEYRIDKKVYDSFAKVKGAYISKTTGEKFAFYNSWFGSIFTYQFSHSFIDFSNMVDSRGIDWFENSVIATKCARQYCIDNPEGFSQFTHNENSWGLTACDTPNKPFYNGKFGNNPTGHGHNNQTDNDGTMSLAGSVGSMPFLPEECQQSVSYYYKFNDGALVGKYGLYDSYNLETGDLWVAKDVIGIDKGVALLMIENYRSGLIWECINQADFMATAIEVLGFQSK
jgi:hypothetical protein